MDGHRSKNVTPSGTWNEVPDAITAQQELAPAQRALDGAFTLDVALQLPAQTIPLAARAGAKRPA